MVLQHRERAADAGQRVVGDAEEVRNACGVEDSAAAPARSDEVGVAVEVGQPDVLVDPLQPSDDSQA